MFFECPPPQPPSYAYASLEKSSYGFSCVDLGLSDADLTTLEQIRVTKNLDCHQFGDLSLWEEQLDLFLQEIGPNTQELSAQAASVLYRITETVFDACPEETFWVSVIASMPTPLYDIPRWHMDGNYFKRAPGRIPYKFVFAPLGPPTLFYLLPVEWTALRSVLWQITANRRAVQEMCYLGSIFSPERGHGVFLIGSDPLLAALHSEPPIHEERLFLSLIPCSSLELKELHGKLVSLYQGVPKSPP